MLKAHGASYVVVSEPTATRGAIATACGADMVLNPLESDVVAEVRKAVKGGVDVAIDCAGNQRTFDAACGATGPKSRIVMVALWDKEKRAALDFSASRGACRVLLRSHLLTLDPASITRRISSSARRSSRHPAASSVRT